MNNTYSLSLLKWEIIKKYSNKDYRRFNLGEIYNELGKPNGPYFGLFLHKAGLSNKIIEYSKDYDIVINKYLYTLYSGVNIFINSFKRKK